MVDARRAAAGRWPQAKASRKPALSEDARIEQADELTKQASALWEQGKVDLAAKKFEQAGSRSIPTPGTPGMVWAGLASTAARPKKPSRRLRSAWHLSQTSRRRLNGLGQAYLSKREYEKAEQYLIKAPPKAPPAWYGLRGSICYWASTLRPRLTSTRFSLFSPSDETMKQCLTAAQKGELPAELRKQIKPPKVELARCEVGEDRLGTV